MGEVLDEWRPKGLLHFAWFVEPGKLITDPSNLAWASASLDLVRAFRESGGQRCAVSGSCYEYDWRFGYCVEDVTPCEPDTLYGAAKDSLRRTFLAYCNASGLSGSWGRAFFMYGPRENPARLVSSVIISLLRGLPAKIVPRPAGARLSPHSGCRGRNGGAVRLGRPRRLQHRRRRPTTIREIVELLGKITGRSELLQIGALPARANERRWYSATAAAIKRHRLEAEVRARKRDSAHGRLVARAFEGEGERGMNDKYCNIRHGNGGFWRGARAHEAGLRPVMYDMHDHIGGHTASYEFPGGWTFDEGPHVSFTEMPASGICFAANVDGNYEEFATRVNNYWKGHWIKHPAQINLHGLPTELVTRS